MTWFLSLRLCGVLLTVRIQTSRHSSSEPKISLGHQQRLLMFRSYHITPIYYNIFLDLPTCESLAGHHCPDERVLCTIHLALSVSILSFLRISSRTYTATTGCEYSCREHRCLDSEPQTFAYQRSSQCSALLYNTPGSSTMDVIHCPRPTFHLHQTDLRLHYNT